MTKLAVAGCGLVGKRHITAIKEYQHDHNSVDLVAIIDPDSTKQELSSELNTPWFSSLDEMFASSCKPDGVILATPNITHVETGQICIKHHCPVLIEKPIAVSVGEAVQLVDLAKRTKVPILVGHHRRHIPLIQKAKEIIDDDRLGKVRAIHGTCWLYKPDDYFDEAEWRKKKGAGPIFVNLIHDIDLIRYLCGEIVSVFAQSSPSFRGYENEDVASAILQLSNGALCTLSISDTIVSPWSWELTAGENPVYPQTEESCYIIGGTDASLSIPDLSLWQHKDTKSWWSPIGKTNISATLSDPFVSQIKQFVNVIRGEEEPLISGEEATKSLQVIEAMHQSISTKQIIDL
jgi:predicted dehydrogenase